MGATWRRVDLHLHTFGVASFSCPDGADPKTSSGQAGLVKLYVDQLAVQGISICAITDYNGIRVEWFEPIRDEAGERGIKVIPGAEVSFRTPKYGLHVLAIFPDAVLPGEVNSFLQALDRDPARPLLLPDGRHRDIELTNINEQGALQRLRDRFGCLVILPHPDGSNGLCQSFRPADAAAFLAEVRPDALEHCPNSELRKLKSESLVSEALFANLSQVEFSDPHRIQEIGTKKRQDGTARATYLKLSASDLDALRLAFHDPATRLTIGSVPQPTHARIRRMEVSGSGFLGNLIIAWNDDLNVVIGGRGTGKSAILETLRYSLGIEPYSEHSYRNDLVNYALGSGGKVALTLERPIGNGKTRTYRVVRVWGEEPRVSELDPDRPIAVRPSDLFGPTGGPTIFGQREIYAVSGSEEYRLKLLDELIGEEARQRATRVEEALDWLRSNARVILDGQKRLAKREEHRQRLKTMEHEISVYEKHGVAEKLKAATTLRSDGQHFRGAIEAVERAHHGWSQRKEETLLPLASAARNLRKGQSVQKTILDEAATAVQALERGIRDLYDKGEALFKEAAEVLSRIGLRWQEALLPLEEELNRIKQEAKAEALDPDRLLRLTDERTAIAPLIEELDRVEGELKVLREKRTALIETVRDRRHQEHQLRRERADAIEELLEGRLHLVVEFKGQKDEYKRRLLTLLKGSGVSADAVERLATPDATDGLVLAEVIRAGSSQVQERFGLTPAMAERLVKWLTDDESRLFELETIIPGDALRVDLRVEGVPRTLDRLSPGQRATAILLLLFVLHGRVLVLDQPEDDLDNRFIYEDIVQILREQKGLTDAKRRRQIIAATHNPNIPVIGDAELVLALEARDGRAQAIGHASIDDRAIRELIKTIMEGGEEAFRRRAEKYGGL
jgi:ABC-type transporter Mla subunit MlaD